MGKIEKKRNTKKNKRSMRSKTIRNNRMGGSPESDKAKIKSIDKKISDVNEDIKNAKREYNRTNRELRTFERTILKSINSIHDRANHYQEEQKKNSEDLFYSIAEGRVNPIAQQRMIDGINILNEQESLLRNEYVNQVQNYDNLTSINQHNFQTLNSLELYLDELEQEREAIERRIRNSGKSSKSPGTPKRKRSKK
tara:strand:+ start:323 stop:910 length:588 start_codon:yes stop_codon:yes gene_type:complete